MIDFDKHGTVLKLRNFPDWKISKIGLKIRIKLGPKNLISFEFQVTHKNQS